MFRSYLWPLLFVTLTSGCATGLRVLDDDSSGKSCSNLPLKLNWVGPKETIDTDKIARPIEGYKVYLKPTSEKLFRENIDVGPKTEYTFKNLIPGATYEFKVVAYNKAGESTASTPVKKSVCQGGQK